MSAPSFPPHRWPDTAWQVPEFALTALRDKRSPYCLCIPVINEGQRIQRQLERLQESGVTGMVDVLLADGGSTDGSLAPELLARTGVRALLVKQGPGKLSAQLRIAYAYGLVEGYEGVLTMDGNGKDGVEAVPQFVEALRQGFDLVQGSRYLPGGAAVNTPLSRHLALRYIHAPVMRWSSGFPYTDTTNGFRAYSRRLLLDPRVQPFRSVFNSYELLAYLSVRAPQLGFKVTEVPVHRKYPLSGKVPTKISPLRGNLRILRILATAAAGRYAP